MKKNRVLLLLGIAAFIVLLGLRIPLMENDSAQHASMALTMAQDNDYFNIYKGGVPYLDKPHMHFWLSALSFEVFGYNAFAYRLPAILLTLLGLFSIYRLAKLLYKSEEVGQLAALVFVSAQTIILSLHDVRTDAVLVGFTITSIWLWMEYLNSRKLKYAVAGGLALAFAFSTKGIVAIGVVGAALFFRVYYRKYWDRIFTSQVFAGIGAFVLGILPVLYAYFHQFGWEGIGFILLGQGVDRFAGDDWGGASSGDFLFYFHTMLWTFFPWSLIFYFALMYRIRRLMVKKYPIEITTWATPLLFMLVMNFSQFKLPHYINIVIPLAAIAVAGFMMEIQNKRDLIWRGLMFRVQLIVAIVTILVIVYLGFVAFPLNHIFKIFVLIGIVVLGYYLFRKEANKMFKIVILTFLTSMALNFVLNSNFYPQLLGYQSGNQLGEIVVKNNIDPENIYKLESKNSWSFDFLTQSSPKQISMEEAKKMKKPIWILTYEKSSQDFVDEGFQVVEEYSSPHYRITRLNLGFLNPASRKSKVKQTYLLQLTD